MASLFGKNKLKENANKIATPDIIDYIDIVKAWQYDYHHGTLKTDKETSREQSYNQDFFIKILGYKEKPASPWSFEPKATTEKGQLPDAVISHEGEVVAAVVELKGAYVPLDRPQRREGNMSPVQQAFKYKFQYRKCPFVVVSNFWEFRLYQDNQLDYEVWTLDDLINPDEDYRLFKTWYALLKAENFVAKSGESKTESLLSEVRIDQEEIGNKFYDQYKEARLELLRDLWRNNKALQGDFERGIEKAQKIIDRVVFICFAEDRGLLPDHILQAAIDSAKASVFGGSIWNALKGFFDAIDKGSEKLEIPNGYNGGLFKTDSDLNNLVISDEALLSITSLGNYDFVEDLSVSILGHIFEQSISDLEEIRLKVNCAQGIDKAIESRRKKEGIFYTPDYIVRYIVENSVGEYLRKHEETIKNKYRLKSDIQDRTYEQREKQAYAEYYDFLQNVKVLDPACGSGAFLVNVFDYLLAEHQRVDQILGNTIFGTDEYVRSILNNNIYGVDVNEESVEITKLSLWLKTAQKGKQLTALDGNIKCGNSLVDNRDVVGEKAFNWKSEFEDIFVSGGFDVVVMNPPYVDSESMTSNMPEQREFMSKNYKNTKGNWDLYIPFIELSFSVLRDGGYSSFITPDKWIAKPFGKTTRENYLPFIEKIAFAGRSVFSDAKVDAIVTVLRKAKSDQLSSFDGNDSSFPLINTICKSEIKHPFTLDFLVSQELPILSKIESQKKSVSDIALCDGACATSDAYKLKDLIDNIADPSDSYMKMINTGTINKYVSRWGFSPMTYLGDKYLHPVINKQLFKNEFGNSYYNKSIQSKLILKGLTLLDVCADFDANVVPGKTTLVIMSENLENLRFLLVFLNSRLPIFYIKQKYSGSSYNGGITFTKDMLNTLPLPELSDELFHAFVQHSYEYIDIADKQQVLSDRFLRLISVEFGLEKIPSKLSSWWRLEFGELVKALGLKLSITQKDELLDFWNKYQPELTILERKKKTLDDDVNHQIYQLYGLSQEEIAAIES